MDIVATICVVDTMLVITVFKGLLLGELQLKPLSVHFCTLSQIGYLPKMYVSVPNLFPAVPYLYDEVNSNIIAIL